MVSSDATFTIGKTHKVCQDYALAADAQAPFATIWLADGCSSSPHTDIGARLLTHSIREQIGQGEKGKKWETFTHPSGLCHTVRAGLTRAARSVQQLGLPRECLDATLLGVIAPPIGTNGDLHAVLYGDGAVVYGLNDGTRLVYRSKYPANFPYYPTYEVDTSRRSRWETVGDNTQIVTRTVLEVDGSVRESETLCPAPGDHLWKQPADNIRWAAVLSDGIESFQQRIGSDTSSSFAPVNYLEVVRHLTAFKNFAGEFVHRRVQAFEKECVRRGWHHNDDIAISAIYFDNGVED